MDFPLPSYPLMTVTKSKFSSVILRRTIWYSARRTFSRSGSLESGEGSRWGVGLVVVI